MRMEGNITKAIIGTVSMGAILVFFIVLSLNQPVTVTGSQAVKNGVNTLTINKTCTDIIPSTGLCQNSKVASSVYQNQTSLPPTVALLPPNANVTPAVITTPTPTTSQPITLQVIATSTDDTGKITTEKNNNVFNLFDLTYKSDSNAPFNIGQVGVQLSLIAKPSQQISMSGILMVSLNGIQKYPQGISIGQNGLTDSSGKIILNMQTPTSVIQSLSISPSQDNIGYGTSTYVVSIQNMTLTTGEGKSYKNNSVQKIYSVSFTKNQYQTSLQNENGTYGLGYPSDDQFSICGQDTSTTKTQSPTPSSYSYRAGPQATVYTYTWYLTPSLGVAQVSTNGQQIASLDHTALQPFTYAITNRCIGGTCGSPTNQAFSSGGYCLSTQNIPRNAQVTIAISGSYPYSQTIQTPTNQESYKYLCTSTTSGTSCNWSQTP
jgi:hypothetical protein